MELILRDFFFKQRLNDLKMTPVDTLIFDASSLDELFLISLYENLKILIYWWFWQNFINLWLIFVVGLMSLTTVIEAVW